MKALTWLLAGVRRLWDETVAPPIFGEAPTLRRVLRLRMASALVLALPAHLFVAFYLSQALLAHYRTVRGTGEAEPLSVELLHLHLHDRLWRDLHHLFVGSGSVPGRLERLSLRVHNADLDRLDANLPPQDGREGYVPGRLEHRGASYDVGVRYRGSNHWHWNYAQKSWKIRLADDRHLLGHDSILLTNSPDAEPLLEIAALELARRRGLMVPHLEPLWLEVNGHPLGVYLLEAPVDEAVLRHSRRFPWNIYSGNGGPTDPVTGVSRLFDSVTHWTKVASPLEQKEDMSELVELLEVIRQADLPGFAQFAQERLDLRAFAEYDAIDVLLGIDQHNYDENHKFYYDPYRGRFEPIVWNLRGGNHEPLVQRAPSPLTLRLGELPAFVDLRDAAVWELLQGDGQPEAIEARLDAWDTRLQAAFEQDPYWDAVNILPKLSPYYEDMVRPMNRAKQLEAREQELALFRERNEYLRGELARVRWSATLSVPATSPRRGASLAGDAPEGGGEAGEPFAVLRFELDGRAPLELLSLEPRYAGDCRPQAPAWRRRVSGGEARREPWQQSSSLFRGGAPPVLARLHPGTVRVPRRVTRTRGPVRLEPAPQIYDLELDGSGCSIESVLVRARNVRTGATYQELVPARTEAPPPPATCPVVFEPGPGGRGVHPWCGAPPPPPTTVRLGPGLVEIAQTRVYGVDEQVVIAPGTTVKLGRGASLVFHGRVTAVGRPGSPIRFTGEGWGVLAITGEAASGSSLADVEIDGGREGKVEGRHFTGMLSVHDTTGFRLRSARLRDAKGEDALHLVYARKATLDRLTVERSATDGIDLEHSDVTIHELVVRGAGDDTLDLMGVHLDAQEVSLLDCADNGISIGEESDVRLERAIIARCPMGLLVKNASRLALDQVVVVAARTGIRVERRSDYYLGESSAQGSGLWFIAVDDPRSLVDEPRFEVKPRGEPTREDLSELLGRLGLDQPFDLVGWTGPTEARR